MIAARWLGFDISGYVSSAPDISVMAEKNISDKILSVTLINRNGIFDEIGSCSIISGIRWRGTRFEAIRGSDKVVSGVVVDGVSQNGSLVLSVQSDLASSFQAICNAVQYQVDPAEAILFLLKISGLTDTMIDVSSFERVSSEMQYRNVMINAITSKQHQTPLLDAINALIEMGSMRIWFDGKIHIGLLPSRPQHAIYLQIIKPKDILGEIEYSTTPDPETAYSIGYLGDSSGKLPATGGVGADSKKIWTQTYNATSQWQLVNEQAAHGVGVLRVSQMQRRRTAKIKVRDTGTIPVCMLSIYEVLPWRTLGVLVGYQKADGVMTLLFEEAF